MSHSLTEDQNTRRVKWYRKTLMMFDNGQFRYMNSIVADDTFQYYNAVPIKSQNKIWIFELDYIRIDVKKSRSVTKWNCAVCHIEGS